MRPILSLILVLMCSASAADPFGAATNRVLAPAAAAASMPGPRLWKVSRDQHTLWVLGTLTPLPRSMTWSSPELEDLMTRAGVLLMPPRIDVQPEGGALSRALLVPDMLEARRNPDGARLQDVLPAPLYARWRALKARYLPYAWRVERWRPMFAAGELYESAIEKSGLSLASRVPQQVERLARRHGVPRQNLDLKLTIADPKTALREFSGSGVDDLECFARVIERIERDLGYVEQRAKAWAAGDLAALRTLPHTDVMGACAEAALHVDAIERRGYSDLPQRMREAWLAAAERALSEHRVSIALLRMDLMLAEDGYLAALAARGYRVEAPDDRQTRGAAGDHVSVATR